MEKERKNTLVSVVLYSLCSLIVGGVVGGTLLMKITQGELSSVPETVRAEQIETTALTVSETTTTTVAAEVVPDADSLRELLAASGDLFSIEYPYTDSDRFELHSEVFGRRVPFTSSSVILTYSGTITIAVPVDAIAFAVDVQTKQITITLPEPEVTSHTLDTDSVRCYDVDSGLFSARTADDYIPDLIEQKNVVLSRVLYNQNLYARAAAQVQNVARGLLSVAAETKNYAVQFVVPELPVVTTAPAETTAPPQTSFPGFDDNTPFFEEW